MTFTKQTFLHNNLHEKNEKHKYVKKIFSLEKKIR